MLCEDAASASDDGRKWWRVVLTNRRLTIEFAIVEFRTRSSRVNGMCNKTNNRIMCLSLTSSL